jgi:tRNA nucleotidyltransferase (CCA-adding enzyme)
VRGHACRLPGRAGPLPATPEAARRWLSAAGPPRAGALVGLVRAEARAASAAPRRPGAALPPDVERLEALVEEIRRDRPPLAAGDLALDGRAVMALLGAGPGPHVGEALRALLDRVLADPTANDPETLAEALRAWWAARGGSL